TLDDLYHWNTAIFADRILSPASRKLAHTPALLKGEQAPKESGYGYGWGIAPVRGLQSISHSGGLDGFLSNLSYLPEKDFTVVILTNAAPAHPGLDPGSLSKFIAQLYLWSELPPRPALAATEKLDANALDQFVGRYDYGRGAILVVRRDETRLIAQLSGQPGFEIFAQGNDKFAWKAVDAQVQFHRDDAGKITGATHFQGGITIEAKRLEARSSITVKPEILPRYVGKYDYGDGAIMTITLEKGDQLKAQLTGQPALPVYPQSETVFYWKEVEAEIEFVSKDGGKTVSGVIHRQGGRSIDAPRVGK
ncbi:MAG: DUF3471 domain-containing protein, partial [Verrucomicrobiales bacterium]